MDRRQLQVGTVLRPRPVCTFWRKDTLFIITKVTNGRAEFFYYSGVPLEPERTVNYSIQEIIDSNPTVLWVGSAEEVKIKLNRGGG